MNWLARPHPWRQLLWKLWAQSRPTEQRPTIWLTFDDGPHPDYTPRILDQLAKHHIRACFFVIGQAVQRFPKLVREIHSAGHELGNHTWSHADLARLSLAQITEEFQRTQQAIADACGVLSQIARPPFGHLTWKVWYAACRLNLQLWLWSIDSNDWKVRDEIQAARCTTELQLNVQQSEIVLLHDTNRFTPEIVARWLEISGPKLSSRSRTSPDSQ